MSGEGKGGAAIAGAGILGAALTGARYCDDAARVGRLGGEVATVGRLGDDVLQASHELLRHADDPVIAARLSEAGGAVEQGGQGRWLLSEADAVELTVDIGLEVLGSLERDTGADPLTPPIQQLSGMWVGTGVPPTAPVIWLCDEPPQADRRRCAFFFKLGEQMLSAEGLLVVREGVICRTILSADLLTLTSPQDALLALNHHPCDRIIASDGGSLTLSGPGGTYPMLWAGEE